MSLKSSRKGGDFELAPSGPQPARCYRVIDLGTQPTKFGPKAKVMLTFELLGDERMNDGRPFSISQRYTNSMHEKGNLSRDLESWRGKAFTPDERVNFDLSKLVGSYCLLNVTHTTKDDTEYANISTIMPLPKSMGRPDGVNEKLMFDLDNPDMKIFETFGDKLKATIQQSAEWVSMKGSGNTLETMPDDVPWDDEVVEKVKEYDF